MPVSIEFQMPCAAEIHLTYRCDLACRTCNRACFVKPAPVGDMTVEMFRDFLRDAARLPAPVKFLILIGGEPTLHEDLHEFLRLARCHVRPLGGQVEIFSNGHAPRTKQILAAIPQDNLCRIDAPTQKAAGSVDFPMNTMFVSPLDVGLQRTRPCEWHHATPHPDRVKARVTPGISVDSRGCTICPAGGAVSRVIAPHAITRRLADLADPAFAAWQTDELCRHCGANMTFPPEILKDIPRVAGNLMTPTWADGFRRLEAEGLRLVDGVAAAAHAEERTDG